MQPSPLLHSTLDPENTVETTRVKTLGCPAKGGLGPGWSAKGGLVSLVWEEVPQRGWGLLRGGEGKIQHPETQLQPGWEAGSGLWAGAAPL